MPTFALGALASILWGPLGINRPPNLPLKPHDRDQQKESAQQNADWIRTPMYPLGCLLADQHTRNRHDDCPPGDLVSFRFLSHAAPYGDSPSRAMLVNQPIWETETLPVYPLFEPQPWPEVRLSLVVNAR